MLSHIEISLVGIAGCWSRFATTMGDCARMTRWLGALALAACSGEAAPTAPTAPTGMNPPAYAALGAAAQDGGAPLPASRGDGTMRVRVHDDRDQPVPCRLTFAGVGRTPTARFTTRDIGRDQQGGILAFDRAFLLDDAELELPVGEYDV